IVVGTQESGHDGLGRTEYDIWHILDSRTHPRRQTKALQEGLKVSRTQEHPPAAGLPLLPRSETEQLLRECRKPVRLLFVPRRKADDTLHRADVAVAGQIAEKRGQIFVHHLRDPNLFVFVLHTGQSGQRSIVFSNERSQRLAVPTAGALSVTDDRFNIDTDLAGDVR